MRLPGSYCAGLRLARVLARVAYDYLPRTAVARENIRLALGRDDPGLCRATYRHFAEAAMDVLFFRRLYDPARFAEHFRYEGPGWEHYRRERPRGAILASGHFGNWELLGASARDAGAALSVVAKSPENQRLSRRVNDFRRSFGQEVIQKQDAALGTMRAIRKGRIVVFLMDQSAGVHGSVVPFFGRPAWTFTTPAALAQRLKVPLYASYSTRLGPGIRYRCWFEHVPVTEDAEEVTLRLNRILERFVRDRPEQWWWFHRRFKPPHFQKLGRVSPAGIPLAR